MFFGFFPCILLTWYTRGVKERQRPLVGIAKNGKGEKDRLILLMMGRDSLLLSTYLDWSTVLSDIDMPTWRNRASLRVRFSKGVTP